MPEPLARLIELEDGGRRRVHELGPGVFVLGRDAGADLNLDHVDVSRRHAELHVSDAGAEVRDLGSKNGVTVAGRKVARAALDDGVELGLGGMRLVFEHQRIDRLLARNGELTARRPRAPVADPDPAPSTSSPPQLASSLGPSLRGPILAALAFAALLTALLVFG